MLVLVLTACSTGGGAGRSAGRKHRDRPVTTTTVARVTRPDQLVPPVTAAAAAQTLVRVERGLRADDRDARDLPSLGWEQQLAYRELFSHPEWVDAVLAALPDDVRTVVQANLDAGGALQVLTDPQPQLPDWTILAPPPAVELLGYYQEAERTFGISWAYLAAIHFVETRMGRIHGNSSAGAQGPMQFIPSTWAAYGDGGDVQDNHDAIQGAARYLAASGGPRDMARALYAYNPSTRYVTAIDGYAQLMLADARAYDGYYYWQVYYRTVDGTQWLPEGWTRDS